MFLLEELSLQNQNFWSSRDRAGEKVTGLGFLCRYHAGSSSGTGSELDPEQIQLAGADLSEDQDPTVFVVLVQTRTLHVHVLCFRNTAVHVCG